MLICNPKPLNCNMYGLETIAKLNGADYDTNDPIVLRSSELTKVDSDKDKVTRGNREVDSQTAGKQLAASDSRTSAACMFQKPSA